MIDSKNFNFGNFFHVSQPHTMLLKKRQFNSTLLLNELNILLQRLFQFLLNKVSLQQQHQRKYCSCNKHRNFSQFSFKNKYRNGKFVCKKSCANKPLFIFTSNKNKKSRRQIQFREQIFNLQIKE